jgi:hypothetical protein
MTRDEILTIAALVAVYWPAWQMPDPAVLVDAWGPILADVGPNEAKGAVIALVTDGEVFAPSIGVVRRRALTLRGHADGTAAPDVDQAWAEVQTGIRTYGFSAGPPGWSHPAIDDVVKALTWRRLCLDDNLGMLHAHFRDFYRPAAARAEAERILPNAARELVGADLARALAGRARELGS